MSGAAVRYLLMTYENEIESDADPAADAALAAQYATFTKRLSRRGVLRGAERLHPTDCATTVAVRDGKLIINDGPAAQAEQQISWYYLIECADLDEALDIAGEVPSARTGTIEVRPIWATHTG
jgi:hypothetical protein